MALPRITWKQSRFHKGIGNLNAEGFSWWAQNMDLDESPPFARPAAKLFKETDSTALATLADVSWGTVFEGKSYAVNASNGKFFRYTSPNWVEMHTNTQSWGGLGLFGDSQMDSNTEYGTLYYASNGNAGRYVPSGSGWTDLWQAFATSNNNEYCPITKFLKFICYGNQRYLAVWDIGASSWNATRITLPAGYKIKWLAPLTDTLVIGASNDAYGSALFIWDGISATYNRVVLIPGMSIPAAAVGRNVLYIITGDGWINRFDGNGLEQLERFPDMQAGDSLSINPDAVKFYQGVMLIGMKAHGSNMAKRFYAGGVWCFNPDTRALYFKHTLSHGGTTNIAGGGVLSVGSIFLNNGGTAFRVAYWKGNSAYAIDVNNNAGSYQPYDYNAVIVSPLLDDEPYRRKRFIQSVLNFWRPLPNFSTARYIVKYNTTEQYQKLATFATGGTASYFTASSGVTPFEVGDEVTVLSGSGAGQIRHVKSIDATTGRLYVDEDLSGGASYDNTSYLLVTPFKKIGTVRGDEVPGAVNKLFRFNARAKKIQIKVEIWSPSGYTGQDDMGIKDMTTVYVPDRIIK